MTERPNTAEAPIKIQGATKAVIKLGAAILGKTMGEFTEDAVSDFLARGKDMVEANQMAILAGESIPYPLDVYSEELSRREVA